MFNKILSAFLLVFFVTSCASPITVTDTPTAIPVSSTITRVSTLTTLTTSTLVPSSLPPKGTSTFTPLVPTSATPSCTPSLTPSRTPSLTPTSTPTFTLLAPRFVEMPWGTVNLDPSIEENNDHAMSTWCYRQVELIEADRVRLWSTNPMGMLIGRPVPRSMLNIEVLSRDADWRVAQSGEKYFNATVVARNTADQSDMHRFTLQIYRNAPLAINAPVDERFNGNSKYWSLFVPIDARVTDPNQIRVGQIYALIDRLTSWGGAPDVISYRNFTIKLGMNPLGLYPVPVPWLCTCAFKQHQEWIK